MKRRRLRARPLLVAGSLAASALGCGTVNTWNPDLSGLDAHVGDIGNPLVDLLPRDFGNPLWIEDLGAPDLAGDGGETPPTDGGSD